MVSRHRTEGRDNGLKCGTVGTVELTSGIATVLRVYFGYPGNEFHCSNRSNLADAPPAPFGSPASHFRRAGVAKPRASRLPEVFETAANKGSRK